MKLKGLVEQVPDESDYDGAIIIAVRDGAIKNLLFTGAMPDTDQRKFLFSKLLEAVYAVTFPPTPPESDHSID